MTRAVRLTRVPRPTDDDETEATNSWRYLFNEVGDLVAVRDPRGCGQNFFYDFGGRLVGEQYVSCAEAQRHAASRRTARWTHAGEAGRRVALAQN